MSKRQPPKPIYVNILTGFLGAGKTTLLNDILKNDEFGNSLVLINEFGDVGLDHLLIEEVDQDMLVMSSGCICCSIRGDLVDHFEKIIRDIDNGRMKPIDQIIIETTGVADPGPIISSFMSHKYLNLRLNLANVTCLVDASTATDAYKAYDNFVSQIEFADQIILTKEDLADDEQINNVLMLARGLNPLATILNKSEADLIEILPKNVQTQFELKSDHNEHHHDHHHHHDHGSISSIAFVEDDFDQESLIAFLDLIRSMHGEQILRIKGIIKAKQDGEFYVMHGVGHLLFPAKKLIGTPPEQSSLVIIGNNVDQLGIKEQYNAFFGKTNFDQADFEHQSDNPLSLLGIKMKDD